MTNPLLADWTGPFALPPFAEITDADFGPAFDAALAEGCARIQAIAGDPAPATFANTIAASSTVMTAPPPHPRTAPCRRAEIRHSPARSPH